MKTYFISRQFAFLILLLSLSTSGFAQPTNLTVGCGTGIYPDFTSLRSAFQWVETNYFPGDVDISICPGTYYENAYINPFALSGPSHEIRVHSSTYNPADVTIHETTMAQQQVLRINGVNYMDFEGITFEVFTIGTSAQRHAVRTHAGAGNLKFRNCKLMGIMPTSPGYSSDDYSVVAVNSLNGGIQFFNSELSDGAMGLHIQSVTSSSAAIVNFQNSGILQVKGDGIKEDVPVFLTEVNNSYINCYGTGYWNGNGITTQYAPNTYLNVTNTSITTFGAYRCHGILAQSHFVSLKDNDIKMAEHNRAFGVTIHGETFDTEVTGNEIDYPGMMYTTVRPDSFMGIQRVSGLNNNIVLDRIQIDENEVRCNGADEGIGIYTSFILEDLSNGLFVRDNEVFMDNMGAQDAFWIMGIALHNRSSSKQTKAELIGNQVYLKPLNGMISYGIWFSQLRPQGDGLVYNNIVEMAQAGTDSSTGLGVANVRTAVGGKTYIGNNSVSLESIGNDHTNGLYLHMTNNDNNYTLWHNSVNVHGVPGVKPSDALHIWGYLHGGEIKMINNAFVNTTGGRAFHNALFTGNWTFSNSNCYYSLPGNDLGAWGAAPIPNLSVLQAVSPGSGDLQSVELDPIFAAPNNLHLSGGSPLLGINGILLPFAGPTYELNWDFEGDGRQLTNNREIGCDERGLPELPGMLKTALEPLNDAYVFPNPATDQVQFVWEGHTSVEIELFNQQGVRVQRWSGNLSEQALDLSGFAKGIYILQARDAGSFTTKKLVIQ